MPRVTVLALLIVGLTAIGSMAQSTEYVFSPEATELSDPFWAPVQNGARGLSGPFDLDRDGHLEMLVAQHTAGGRVHVIENTGVDTWELVYSTPVIDSTVNQNNTRFATAADLDGDGNWEIVYVAGTSYNRDRNPLYQIGVYVWEHDGVVSSDNYGSTPATVGAFYNIDPELAAAGTPSRSQAQNLIARDVDGDGTQELLVPADGTNTFDIMYVLSVSGEFEPNGLGTTFEAWNIEARVAQRLNGNFYGGGSSYGIIPADLDGDGNLELSFHAFNDFSFFNGKVTGPDTYAFGDTTVVSPYIHANSRDDVNLFGGVAVDIDGDGNDEVFHSTFLTGKKLAILDYDPGDNVFEMTPDKVVADILPGWSGGGGMAAGDVDGDGAPEIISGGSGYSAGAFNSGQPSHFLVIAEYNGGDPKVGSSYGYEELDTSSPADSASFNLVFSDSAGIKTQRYESAHANEGEVNGIVAPDNGDNLFPTGVALMGDADGDGSVEVAVSFQGVDDTLATISELYSADSLFGVFNTPDGEANPGPIGPGQSYSFSFDAAPGSFFSFATMFLESNDLFFAPADSGIALWDSEGHMRSGDITSEIMLWDAGTELNEEPFVGPNQAPRQDSLNTGEADSLKGVSLCCEFDGFDYPAVAEVINVTLAADEGTGVFTVTITNVSTAGKLDAAAAPLAPGVYVIGPAVSHLFEAGKAASAGLEALAEDGVPTVLNDALLGTRTLVFFRTLIEKHASDLRSFVRVFSLDGMSVKTEDDRIVLPSDYKLSANYPNPFNPTTNFSFTLPIDKKVSVKIYDIMGRLVSTLVNDELLGAGTHQVTWNGRDATGQTVASGQYIYTLEYGNFRQSRTMILLK